MLQMLREKVHGLIAWSILVLLAAAFLFFGGIDYLALVSGKSTAAKVNGQKISWHTIDELYERFARRYEGQPVDEKRLRDHILITMVQRAALLADAKALGFRVGDEQVGKFLVKMPAFQENGQFSKEQYLKLLAQESYTDIGFRRDLSQDILLGQLEQGLVRSNFTLPSELQNSVALLEQKRDFGYFLIPADTYKDSMRITSDQIEAYYHAHKANFVNPEQVILEYVELSLDQLANSIKPSKEEVKAFYHKHIAVYTTPERVHARHILVTAPATGSQHEEAKEKVNKLLSDIKQGADFVKLAKAMSEDVGSAGQGGDLGWFVRGQMVPEFEQAVFALRTPGDIAGPVRTQFGYHFIQLVEYKKSEVRPFEQVKNVVEEQLKREQAEALFARNNELLAKITFEQAGSLTPVVEQLGLKIQETKPFSRSTEMYGGKEKDPIITHPEVLQAAFSEPLLKEARNSKPIKLSENLTVVIRVKKYEPAVQQTLEEAKQKIREQLALENAKTQIKEIGENIVKEMRAGKKPELIAEKEQLKWVMKSNVTRIADDMDRHILMAAFRMVPADIRTGQNVKGFFLPNGDYLVLALHKVQAGNFRQLDPNTQALYKEELSNMSSQMEYALYTTQAWHSAKVKFGKKPA